MGNGPEASGEGYKYRGRGYIQLTGKDNYGAFDKVVPENILETPDLVATKYPLLSAAWFWNSRGLNALSDKGATDADVTAITKKVNGGTIGLADRIKHFKESRWNPLAKNGSHYGIPQGRSIYLSKVNGFKQVEWGLKYIKTRHQTPCLALDHFKRKGWH